MGKLPHILVVSFPAQGHVMPLMKFSHQLVDHGYKITFVNTNSIHKKLVSSSILTDHKEGKYHNKIKLVSVPEFGDILNLKEYISETMAVHLEELIKKINESDDEKIDYVVADACIGGILEIAERFGIDGAAFWPASLGVLAFMLHFPNLVEAGDVDYNGNPVKKEAARLPLGMSAMSTVDLMWSYSGEPFTQVILITIIINVNKAAKIASQMLCNSFSELEPASHDFTPNILTVGPLLSSEQLGHPNGQLWPEDSTCLTWLDQQPLQSVTYIAFGSTTLIDQSQFNELLHGLELVNRPFLLVVRPDGVDDLSASYADGFKDRIAHHGKVVDWAPQKRVLAHPSIACFITHCGWNSTLEAVSMGVPLLCWPYITDQFYNQNYICDILKVGLRVSKDKNGIITRSEIKTKVQALLGDDSIRSRANKLKDDATRSISEGGSSSKNFDDFINRIKC
ncbi:hypothetical protein AQUCO_00600437v1 [Aquilegia coerulea]|uniref:Glycosyltransferase n=1 Tax=Aquilegia coerulea TaxID=218851 RepID=A0A2G5EPL8_AQUCA|nr:hypothetical protein AQUCO_00600437v1 [Aquilegia coerulea]